MPGAHTKRLFSLNEKRISSTLQVMTVGYLVALNRFIVQYLPCGR